MVCPWIEKIKAKTDGQKFVQTIQVVGSISKPF